MPTAGEKWKKWFPQFTGLPKRAWVCVGACLAVPVVTLGGAVPTVIGFMGGSACAKIAKSKWPPAGRIVSCVLIAALTWFATIMTLGALHEAMGRRAIN